MKLFLCNMRNYDSNHTLYNKSDNQLRILIIPYSNLNPSPTIKKHPLQHSCSNQLKKNAASSTVFLILLPPSLPLQPSSPPVSKHSIGYHSLVQPDNTTIRLWARFCTSLVSSHSCCRLAWLQRPGISSGTWVTCMRRRTARRRFYLGSTASSPDRPSAPRPATPSMSR